MLFSIFRTNSIFNKQPECNKLIQCCCYKSKSTKTSKN